MTIYTDSQLVENLHKAINAFRAEGGFLMGKPASKGISAIQRASERSITHRIALHLQKEFENHDVDCEYNRNMERSKEINILFDELTETKKLEVRDRIIKKELKRGVTLEVAQLIADAVVEETIKFKTYPDIIVHKRLDLHNDLIVIEVKCEGDERGEEGDAFDKNKLRAFTLPPYNYQLGVFIKIRQNDHTIDLFKAGQYFLLEEV